MISVTILTKNSEKYLFEVLHALKKFDEIIIFDTGSKDKTFEIAEKFPNVVIHEGELQGFGPTHNRASSLAKNDWILSIDSDEIISEELVKEILALRLGELEETKAEKTVYQVSRRNYYNNKWIRSCGWHPDWIYRLYNKKRTKFKNVQVHEAIEVDGEGIQIKKLNGPLIHNSYSSTSEFLYKMEKYSTLFAEENKGKKKSSLSKAILHGMGTFLKNYIVKRGFLGGAEGFIISVYNANTAFYKYLKLAEINGDKPF